MNDMRSLSSAPEREHPPRREAAPLRVGVGGPVGSGKTALMLGDAKKMRGERPFVFTNLKTGQGLDTVIGFIERQGLLIGS